MADNNTQRSYGIDIEGTEIVSTALLNLLNQFPALGSKKITFSKLDADNGIGFFPTSGAVLLSNVEDITGHVSQMCIYPFAIVYRSSPRSESQKIRVKEYLDTIGKWLERQPVTINNNPVQLSSYPSLGNNRSIKSISRSSAGHLDIAYDNGIEDWVITITLRYANEFDN